MICEECGIIIIRQVCEECEIIRQCKEWGINRQVCEQCAIVSQNVLSIALSTFG